MRPEIEKSGRAFGSTPEGRAWCIKALHPSDPVTEVAGVPDQNSGCSFVQCYQQTVSITPAGQANTWEGEIYLYSDPTNFGCVYVRDGGLTTGAATRLFPNLNLAGKDGNLSDAIENLLVNAEQWRCAYYGVTVQVDAPALSNQGTICAAQYPVRPDFIAGPTRSTSGTDTTRRCPRYVVRYDEKDTAEYDTVMQMPGAFTGPARGGCYMPLKMDSNHAIWHDRKDLCLDGSQWIESADRDYVTCPAAAALTGALYPGLEDAYYNAVTWAQGGDTHLLPCTSNVGAICFRGLSDSATVRLTFRVGFEMRVQPGSLLAPNLHATPAYDRQAIDTYFAIAREMKDAYPADFNDFGRLWEVIKSVASRVAPFVKSLPFGEHIVNVGRAVGAVGDAIARRKAPPKQKKASKGKAEPQAPRRR